MTSDHQHMHAMLSPQGTICATPDALLKAVHEKGWENEVCCHFCYAEFFDGNGVRERHKPDCLFFQIEDYLKEQERL